MRVSLSTFLLYFPFFFRSEKLQNESSPNFSNFRPEFCPEFCPEFSPKFLSFRASSCRKRRLEKIHQKSPQFFDAKLPGKFEEKIHNIFLENGQSNSSVHMSHALSPEHTTLIDQLSDARSLECCINHESNPKIRAPPPTKAMMNTASTILGAVYMLLLS